MTATPGFAFSCDSPDGCHAHAMAAGDDVANARRVLAEALGWVCPPDGDLCPNHTHQVPVPPVART